MGQLGRSTKKKKDDDADSEEAPKHRGTLLKENSQKYAHLDDAELERLLPRRPDGAVSSVGSLLHASGKCSRCVVFDTPAGCASGMRCPFCHMDHPLPPHMV